MYIYNALYLQKSLSFPDGVNVSDNLRDLVSHLLTTPDTRLTFPGLQIHPFFSNIDWDRLQQSKHIHLHCIYTVCICMNTRRDWKGS